MSAIVRPSKGVAGARLRFDVIDGRAEDLDISKTELAKKIGVNYSTMWRYRQGMNPTHPVLMRLQSVLGLTVEEMTQRNTPTTPPPQGPSQPKPRPRPREAA